MKSLGLGLLRLYKRWISPALPVSCRYVPTCSEYAMEAVERYGAWRGGWMAASRLLRCHPFSKGGLDPVVDVEVLRLRDCFAQDDTGKSFTRDDSFGVHEVLRC